MELNPTGRHDPELEDEEVYTDLDEIIPEFNEFSDALSTWMKAVVAGMKALQSEKNISWRSDASVRTFANAYARAIKMSGLPVDELLISVMEFTATDAVDAFKQQSRGLVPVSRGGAEDVDPEDQFPNLEHYVGESENRKRALMLIIGALRLRLARQRSASKE